MQCLLKGMLYKANLNVGRATAHARCPVDYTTASQNPPPAPGGRSKAPSGAALLFV